MSLLRAVAEKTATVEALRKTLFRPFPNTSLYVPSVAPVALPRTQREKILSHYHPDFNHVKIAAADPRFNALELRDEVLEARLVKERRLESRGKTIRVSALTGVNIPKEGFKSKKKKKRR